MDKELFKRVYFLYKPFQTKFAVNLGFTALIQLISICSPLLLGVLIDALTKQKPWTVAGTTVALMISLRVAVSLVSFAKDRYELLNLDFEFPQHVSLFGLEKIMAFSIGQHHNQNSGIKMSLVNKGENSINNLLNNLLYNVVPGICHLLIILIMLMVMNFQLSLIYFFGLCLYAYMSIKQQNKFIPLLKQEEELYNDKSKLSGEMFRNATLVKVNCKTDFVKSEYIAKYHEISSLGKKIWVDYCRKSINRNMAYTATYGFVAAYGVYLLYQGQITAGLLTTYIIWINNISGTLNNLSNVQRNITKSWGAIKDYFNNILMEPAIQDKPNAKRIGSIVGKIQFKEINFSYPTRDNQGTDLKKTLKGLDFTIYPNEKVAIVGHSGAGKSTIIQLLIRAYDPSSGQVLIDGNDLRDIQLNDYLEQVGLVEQEVSMFDNTLAYNLKFGVPDKESISQVTMDEISRACRVSEFFHLLENGYDTVIGEKGIKLSGGQKQRVGIARALMKNPRILILDEATSSLDTENESMIRESIEKASEGRTTIIIAHRLSTIQWVDRIFVVEGGEIVNVGSHTELLNNSPAYQSLMKNQISFV